jgi:hypothetical protein
MWRKISSLGLALSVVFLLGRRALAERLYSLKDTQDWMYSYYQHPKPELVPNAIRILFEESDPMKPDALPGNMGFYGRVLAANPDRIPGWILEIEGQTEDQWFFMANALWNCGTKNCIDALSRFSREGPPEFGRLAQQLLNDKKRPDPMVSPVVLSPESSGATIDMIWGAFYATGDRRYVERIIGLVTHSGDEGKAAQATLAANAAQHPKVLNICRQAVNNSTGGKKKILRNIVAEARHPKTPEKR